MKFRNGFLAQSRMSYDTYCFTIDTAIVFQFRGTRVYHMYTCPIKTILYAFSVYLRVCARVCVSNSSSHAKTSSAEEFVDAVLSTHTYTTPMRYRCPRLTSTEIQRTMIVQC